MSDAERDDLQAQVDSLATENANLHDDLETAEVGWHAQSDKRTIAEAERDRLRDGIRQHREAVEAAGAFVWDTEGNPYQPHDRSLWSLLDDNEEVRRDR